LEILAGASHLSHTEDEDKVQGRPSGVLSKRRPHSGVTRPLFLKGLAAGPRAFPTPSAWTVMHPSLPDLPPGLQPLVGGRSGSSIVSGFTKARTWNTILSVSSKRKEGFWCVFRLFPRPRPRSRGEGGSGTEARSGAEEEQEEEQDGSASTTWEEAFSSSSC